MLRESSESRWKRASNLPAIAFLGLAVSTATTFSSAIQAKDQLSASETLLLLDSLIPRSSVGASTYGIPSGYGLNHGQAYLSGSVTNKRQLADERSGERIDGSYAFGVGFGDPNNGVGIESNVGILSSTPGDQDEAGNLGFKIHKRLDSELGPVGVSAGASNVMPWGDPEAIKTSYYASASLITTQTRFPNLRPDLMITGGASTGARNYGQDPGVFIGIGGKLADTASLSVSWSGDELVAGSTFQPDLRYPVMLSAGIADITKANDAQRLLFSISYMFQAFNTETVK
jgi:hypothetical protein